MRRTVSVYGEVAFYQTTQVFVYLKGDFRATVGDQKALYDLVRQTLLKFSCSHPLSYVTSFAIERVIAVV